MPASRQAQLEGSAGHADLRRRRSVTRNAPAIGVPKIVTRSTVPAALTRPPTELPTSSITAARAALTSPLIAELVTINEAPAEILIFPLTDARSRHVTPVSARRSPLCTPAIVAVHRSRGMTVTRKLRANRYSQPRRWRGTGSCGCPTPARGAPTAAATSPRLKGCRRSAP